MGVSFRATVWTDDYDAWTEVFDEMPTCSCDREEIEVVIDVSENVEGGMEIGRAHV